jgi:hypothetical protein
MKNFFRKFVPIFKVDTAKRQVEGVIAEEAVDKANEIFDYETSKGYVQKWSNDFEKSTNGLSVGNVRAMHSSIAAGKLTAITFDDATKRISVTAKIIDDNEWKKVEQGVYTGFSIGGRYIKKWLDGVAQRYTAAPAEVSIVDNPCMYGATFTAVKADGAEEMRKFVGKPMEKSMWDIGKLACILEDLAWMEDCLEYEAEYEGDGSTVPEQLAAWIETGTTILKQLVEEETAELTGAEKSVRKENKKMDPKQLTELTGKLDALAKDNGELKAKVEALEKAAKPAPIVAAAAAPAPPKENLVEIGTTADGIKIFKKVDAPAADPKDEKIAKLEGEVAELNKGFEALHEGLQKILAVPGKPTIVANPAAVEALGKSTDTGSADAAVDFEKMSTVDQIKYQQARGKPELPFRPLN